MLSHEFSVLLVDALKYDIFLNISMVYTLTLLKANTIFHFF